MENKNLDQAYWALAAYERETREHPEKIQVELDQQSLFSIKNFAEQLDGRCNDRALEEEFKQWTKK